jgi:activator of 2-hydroxyglutaryl-CoA dehydratase
MSIVAGVDIGSTASKAVILADGKSVGEVVGPSSTNPKRTAHEIYEKALATANVDASDVELVVGTGYGRAQVEFADRNISEITCHGRGAHFLLPSVRMVVDIGGQDTKAICIDERGNLLDFAMNDKCAAGTGRFLEAMARSMELPIGEMGNYYFEEGDPCGVELPRIVKGLLLSLAGRVASLSRRLGIVEDIVMTGGVAKNHGVRRAVENKLKIEVKHFDGADPQIVGALGAALIADDLAAGKTVVA